MKKILILRGSPTLAFDISSDYVRGIAYKGAFKRWDVRPDANFRDDTVMNAMLGMARAGNVEACENIIVWWLRKQPSGTYHGDSPCFVEELDIEDIKLPAEDVLIGGIE